MAAAGTDRTVDPGGAHPVGRGRRLPQNPDGVLG
jgi:hypothetical protein